MNAAPIQVWYVVGKDPNLRKVELAKFFSAADAESHAAALVGRAGSQQAWSDLSVERRKERVDEQHESHTGAVQTATRKAAEAEADAVRAREAVLSARKVAQVAPSVVEALRSTPQDLTAKKLPS